MTCFLSSAFLLILFLSRWKKKFINSYIKSFSMIWFLLLIIYYFCQPMFVPYARDFDYYFMLFLFTNILAYVLFSLFFEIMPKIKIKKIISAKQLYTISVVTLIYCILKFSIYFGLSGSFEVLRANVLNEGWSFGVGIAFPFSAGAYYYSRLNSEKKASIFFLISMIILAVISTAKMFFIILLLYLSGFYLKSYSISIGKVISYIILGFVMFALIHILMNKISHKFPDSILLSLIYTLTGYIFGGFGVFQLSLDGLYTNGMGYATFLDFLINNWLQKGSITEGGWVYTGEWLGNVESGFTPWYLYAGAWGIAMLGAFMGAIYAFIYSFSKKYHEFMFLKVYSYYPMIFLVFYDTIMHSFTTWFGFSMVTFLLLLTKKSSATNSEEVL